jgi:hypothetical protein
VMDGRSQKGKNMLLGGNSRDVGDEVIFGVRSSGSYSRTETEFLGGRDSEIGVRPGRDFMSHVIEKARSIVPRSAYLLTGL